MNAAAAAAQLLMVSIAIPHVQRIICRRIYGHVTLMITLRNTSRYQSGIKRVRSIIPVCSKCYRRRSITRRGRVKRQKLTFDLSLLENVRGRNRSRRATNGRVGTRWLRSSARSSSLHGKLNGTTRMNRSDR